MQDSTAVELPEGIDQSNNGGLPLFIVDNVWHLFEESLDDQLHAGLISLALREDIIDVIDAPLSSWGDVVDDRTGVITKAWIPTKYHKYFAEVQRQMQDGGELVRNEFTGLATIKLKYPLGDLKEISLHTSPDGRILFGHSHQHRRPPTDAHSEDDFSINRENHRLATAALHWGLHRIAAGI